METKGTENEEGMKIVRRGWMQDGGRMQIFGIVMLVLAVVLLVWGIFRPGIDGWEIAAPVVVGLNAVAMIVNARRMKRGKKPW